MSKVINNFELINNLEACEIINGNTGEIAKVHFSVTAGWNCEFTLFSVGMRKVTITFSAISVTELFELCAQEYPVKVGA